MASDKFGLPCARNQSLQKRSQTAWEKCDLAHAEHGYSRETWVLQKPTLAGSAAIVSGAEGSQEDLEQSSEELIKRKQVTVSSHLLKKMGNSLLQQAASDLLCWDESPSSSITPQQSKITSVRKTHFVALIRMD